jgi:hypothetical protein
MQLSQVGSGGCAAAGGVLSQRNKRTCNLTAGYDDRSLSLRLVPYVHVAMSSSLPLPLPLPLPLLQPSPPGTVTVDSLGWGEKPALHRAPCAASAATAAVNLGAGTFSRRISAAGGGAAAPFASCLRLLESAGKDSGRAAPAGPAPFAAEDRRRGGNIGRPAGLQAPGGRTSVKWLSEPRRHGWPQSSPSPPPSPLPKPQPLPLSSPPPSTEQFLSNPCARATATAVETAPNAEHGGAGRRCERLNGGGRIPAGPAPALLLGAASLADPAALAQLSLLVEGVGGKSSAATTAQPSASLGWVAAAANPSAAPQLPGCGRFAGSLALLDQGSGSDAVAVVNLVIAAGAGDGEGGSSGQALDQVAAGSMHSGRCCSTNGGRQPLTGSGQASGDCEQLSSVAAPPLALPKLPLQAAESSAPFLQQAVAAAMPPGAAPSLPPSDEGGAVEVAESRKRTVGRQPWPSDSFPGPATGRSLGAPPCADVNNGWFRHIGCTHIL